MNPPDRPTELREEIKNWVSYYVELIDEGLTTVDAEIAQRNKALDKVMELIDARSRTDQRELLERLRMNEDERICVCPGKPEYCDGCGGDRRFFNRCIAFELARLEGEGKQ